MPLARPPQLFRIPKIAAKSALFSLPFLKPKSPAGGLLRELLILIAIGFAGFKVYERHNARIPSSGLSPDNFVEIYMPPGCGGCRICQGQVDNISKLKIRHTTTILNSETFPPFAQKIRTETNNPSLGEPSSPFRMPVMKVNGTWVQGPHMQDLKPLLRPARAPAAQ